MSVNIDAVAFRRRLHALQRDIKDNKHFEDIAALITTLGKGESVTQGIHTSILHIWLLGYPFANTAITVTRDKAVIITSSKQAKHLQSLKSATVEIWIRAKDADESKDIFGKMVDEYAPSGKIGKFASDTPESPIADAWKAVLADKVSVNGLSTVDITSAFDTMLQSKDEEELKAVRTASKASSGVMTQYFADEMGVIIDEGRKITHAQFSNKISTIIDSERIFRQFRLGSEFDSSLLDWAYPPIVQSGHNFSFAPDAKSDESNLQPGVIYCSIGMRYKFYSAQVARTYLIDASKEQEQNYSVLASLEKKVINVIKDGVKCSEVYQAALAHLKEKAPQLVDHLLPSLGHGVGIEASESGLKIDANSQTLLRDGMTVSLQVAFKGLIDEKGGKYGLGLINTLRVTDGDAIVYTDSPRGRSDISFSLATEEESKKPAKQKQTSSGRSSRVLRSETKEPEEFADTRIRNHQRELKRSMQERGLQKYSQAGSTNEETKVEFKKYESYKRETQLPTVKDLRITLDTRASTIIVPINGRPVPFHINSYKNGSKNEEGNYTYLRLNFNSPDAGIAKRDDVPFENPNATFVKSITLRSLDNERMNDTFKKIQEMKREATKREAERKEMADVIQQDKLVEVKDRRPLRLDPIFVRPMPEGKRVAGSLEIHKNGVRYQSPLGKEQQVDVLFSNVDNLIFQPSDHELILLIHFHLKNPIIVGKRKTQDVQFYREASDVTFDDTGNQKRRYRYGDEDELEQEQEERRLRAALNKEFKAFSEQIAKASSGKLVVDIPFRELGFQGAPFRSSVFLQPTTDCLVQLVDTPFLVVKLADVEVVYFERVQFGLREFDLVFVYKDFNRPVTHINTIPIKSLDGVKDWLNEMDIPFYEGPVNMKWPVIMKTVQADPHEFFETGGWSFLDAEDEESKPEDGAPAEDSEDGSEFYASGEELEEESDSYGEDDSEEDLSENSFDEDEESGADWDELEEEAEREDAAITGKKERKRA